MMLCLIYPKLKKAIDFSLILSLCLYAVSASFPELEKSENQDQSAQRRDGYDCGKIFFTDKVVSDALKIASTDAGKENVKPYIGPLYERTMGYLTWPIALDENSSELKRVTASRLWRSAIHQVIFSSNGEVIDLIVRLTTPEHAKCMRVDGSNLETRPQDVEIAKGYLCGNKLILKEHLEKSASFARKYLGKGKMYPKPYVGHLYPKEFGFLIWPIYKGQYFYLTPKDKGSPYMIVLDPTGQIKDVIARTINFSFVKCMHSKEAPPELASNTESYMKTRPPRTGFDCQGIFFDDNDLELASDMAWRSHGSKRKLVFPKLYNGHPFYSPCFLWPIKPSRSTIRNGQLPPYRLVLSTDFKIMCVIVKRSHVIKICEKKTLKGGSLDHDQNDYQCASSLFHHSELVDVAETACKKRNTFSIAYPRIFEGAIFDVPGPYLVYPIIKGRKYYSKPGNHYMVMSYDCVIAGAVTIDKNTGKLKKCDALGPRQQAELNEESE